MLQKLRTVWEFVTKGRQDCEKKLWMRVGRDDTAVFAVMGQQEGSWKWTLCAPSSRFNPWKGRDEDHEKRPAQSLGDPWRGKHCHESTDLVG